MKELPTPTLPGLPVELIEMIVNQLIMPDPPVRLIPHDLQRLRAAKRPVPDNLWHVNLWRNANRPIRRYKSKDIFSLRLTSRELSSKTFRVFARTFFSDIQTDLSTASLHRLVRISKHDGLKHHPQHLHIGDATSTFGGPPPLGTGFTFNRSPTGLLEAPLLVFDALEAMLMTRFVNCRSFTFHGADPLDTSLIAEDKLSWTDAVGAFSLMVARGLAVKSFHVVTNKGFIGKLHADRLPLGEILTDEFRRNWAGNLEESFASPVGSRMDADWGLLSDLVLSAKKLRKLEIDRWARASNGGVDYNMLDQLCSVDFAPGIQDLLVYGGGSLELKDHTLVRFLRHVRHSLRKLKLSWFHLSGWAGVLEALSEGFQLESFALVDAMCTGGLRMLFNPLIGKSAVAGGGEIQLLQRELAVRDWAIVGVHYAGPNMEEALRMIICGHYIGFRPGYSIGP